MEKLHRDPSAYTRDYKAFISELKQFHQNRGTQFRHVPRINGREVDLFLLYNQVTALGGWLKVNDTQRWGGILDSLKLPCASANGSLVLRQLYIRYLSLYEKIHFHGEDPDDDAEQAPDNRARKQQTTMVHSVPMAYNHNQHELTDVQRSALGMAQVFCYPTEYDKLCLSLLSGLPNEQDFALNICTLLSNEGRHTLRLEKNPRLLDLLLAQTGIWPTGDPSLQTFYLECWKDVEGRQMDKFWESTLDMSDRDVTALWKLNKGLTVGNEEIQEDDNDEEEEEELFNLSQNPGIRNAEGQRILRIALILYNVSFESNNVPVLAANPSCLRFLQLCVHCRWSSLRQIALDTLGNLAGLVTLSFKENLSSRLLLRTVTDGIDSTDRFIVIRSLEILAHLAQFDHNDDVLSCCVDFKVFHRIMALLTIHDIMLLVYSLEALYSLSELGRCVCEKIVRVHKAIATLVSLLTLDPQISGPGEANFKLVETFEPVAVMATTSVTPSPQLTASPSKMSTAMSHPIPEIDSESFAVAWLKATYELAHNHSVPRNDLYADYVNYCSKIGRKCVVNANVFSNTVRSVFPHCGLKKMESASGNIIFHHDSIRRRPIPLPVTVTPRVSSPYVAQGPTPVASGLGPPPRTSSPLTIPISGPHSYSPILKAQLSAPLRSQTPPLPSHSNLHQSLSVSPSPPPSPHYPSPAPSPTPPNANSTLIKSLLASKVSRNIQRQQLVQHVPPLASNGYAAKVANKVQSQPVKIMPKGKVVSSPPPAKVIRDAVVPPVQITKNAKTTAKCKGAVTVLANANRLNGIQRDMQLEVCSQAEEATSINSRCQETRIERVQNSLTLEESSNESTICLSGEKDILAAAMSVLGPNFVQSTQNGLSSDLSNDSICSSASATPQRRVGEGRQVIVSPPPSPSGHVIAKATSPNQVLKTVLMHYQPESEEELKKRRLEKDKVYKNSPLLNGLLDRGIIANDIIYFPQTNYKNGNDGSQEVAMTTTECIDKEVPEDTLQSVVNSQILSQDSGEESGGARIVTLRKDASDLSSISDITRTLETASKAISRTNAECHSQIPFVAVPSTTAGATHIVSVVRINPQSIGVPVITTSGNSPFVQTHILRLQAPTVTLKMDNSVELTGFPRVATAQLHQVQLQTTSDPNSLAANALKRPSGSAGTTCIVLEAKRPRQDTKTPLLEASLRNSTLGEATTTATVVPQRQTFQDRTILPKIQPKLEQGTIKSNSQPALANRTVVNPPTAVVLAVATTTAPAPSHVATTVTTPATVSVDSKDSVVKMCNGRGADGQAVKLKYMCEWKKCLKIFPTPLAVFVHASKTHCPLDDTGEATCEWENCDRMKRKRFSLLTHLQDRHCNDQMLHMQAMRRQQMAQFGKSTIPPPQPPPPHPGYAPDAAVLAIRRHALQYLQARELVDEKEGPLTKSIRLTAALVLRNLVIYCPSACSHLRPHEPELANLAMSNVESSRTIAQCLSELARSRE